MNSLMRFTAGFLFCFFFSGCTDGFDRFKCYEAVVKAFPGSEVHSSPRSSYTFIVRKPDGSVWFVKTMGWEASVTSSEQIFAPILCKEASR